MAERELLPRKLRFLSIRDVVPRGYIEELLRTQANGLSGNLHRFWPDIRDSKWIGGDADGWERVPYWLDGIIPLAFLLRDEGLQQDAKRYIDSILERQKPDGWICPCEDDERPTYDVWAVFLLLKVLTVWHDATSDERVYDAVYRALKNLDRHIDSHLLFGWAQMRWYEALIPVYWLAERCNEPWILRLADKLKCQGFDFYTFFRHWPYTSAVTDKNWSQMNHVVNNAMMLKGDSLYYLADGDPAYLTHADYMLDRLDRYHGMVTGAFTGDECLSGDSPVQGTELCSIAEFMYSCEQLVSVTGDSKWADRLERLAFNSLFATLSPDMWTHQYDQQVNQVQCVKTDDPIFNTNGGEANLFGLEPHFGCCTANFSQALPKYVASSFLRADDGIALVNLTPAALDTVVSGGRTRIEVAGEYPFDGRVRIRIETEKLLALYVRVPAFCDAARLKANGKAVAVRPGAFSRVEVSGAAELELTIETSVKIVSRPRGMTAVVKGGLVLSMPIAERWTQINQDVPGREFPHCDYEVRPAEDWNYAWASKRFEVEHRPLKVPLSPDNPPLVVRTDMRRIGWGTARGCCLPVPDGRPYGETVERVLIPYCCTNLRLTETKAAEGDE